MSFDFSGTWVRANAERLERFRAEYDNPSIAYEHLAVDCGGGWYRIGHGTASVADNIPTGTVTASCDYGETIFLRVMAIVGVFELAHADAGTLRRHLQYVEGEWQIVDGTPQPWEPQLLYPPVQLAQWRDWADGDTKLLAELDALEAGTPIARGAFHPTPNVEQLALALAAHFGFRLS